MNDFTYNYAEMMTILFIIFFSNYRVISLLESHFLVAF